MTTTDIRTAPPVERHQELYAPATTSAAAPRSYLAVAVVCALVCFRPLGVAALAHAGNVRTLVAQGDLEGARRASRTAKFLCIASAAVTVFFLLVIVGVVAMGYSDIH